MKLKNVERRTMWQYILQEDTFERSWGWKRVEAYPNAYCCLYEKDWLTNIVSYHDMERISGNTPIFIASQTGTGKTSLIFELLLQIALRERKKVLYLSNRLLLGMQLKQRCMKDSINGYQRVNGIMVKDYPEYYTDKYIKTCVEFGGIDVCSYQRFLHMHYEIKASEYAFVVIDEAHYFLSDATYNVYTEEVLDLIINKFSKTRRIYMSATPEDCLDTIYSKELSIAEEKMSRIYEFQMNVYAVREDYSYVLPYFFSTKEYIVDKIKQSSVKDNWLIFVRDKKTGHSLLTELQREPGGAVYISADTDKEDECYKDLVTNEALPKRILISTKVLDVGVNIKTSNLKIVVFESDVVEVKQMIGRKRIVADEELEVYFFLPSYKELAKRTSQISKEIMRQRENVKHMTKLAKGYVDDLSEFYPLYFHDGIKANYLSISKHLCDKIYYEDLIQRLSSLENDESEYQKEYAMLYVAKLLGQSFNSSMMLEQIEQQNVSDEEFEKVRKLINSWLGKEISKEELETFAKKLMDIVGDYRSAQRKDRGVMKYQTLSKVLPQYGYLIISNKTNPVTYRIKIKNGEE